MVFRLKRACIDVQLDNGVYVFDNKSGVGKSYMLSLIKGVPSDTTCCGVTYNDIAKLKVDLPNLVETVNPNLLFLDRYDMYTNKYESYIKEWAKRMIVLIDTKQYDIRTVPVKSCCLRLHSRWHIEVVR